jgi:hypothetical protein
MKKLGGRVQRGVRRALLVHGEATTSEMLRWSYRGPGRTRPRAEEPRPSGVVCGDGDGGSDRPSLAGRQCDSAAEQWCSLLICSDVLRNRPSGMAASSAPCADFERYLRLGLSPPPAWPSRPGWSPARAAWRTVQRQPRPARKATRPARVAARGPLPIKRLQVPLEPRVSNRRQA